MGFKPSSASAPRKTVLVVEDSITQSESIRAVLENNELNVVCAMDGPSGIAKAQEIHPDLIIMDVNMPGMDGFQVVQVLKANAETSSIPIVMLTSSTTPESALTGLRAGAIDYIPKDVFAMRVLVETVRQMGLI